MALLCLAFAVLTTTASAIVMGETPFNIVLRVDYENSQSEYYVKELDRSFDHADIAANACYKKAEESDWRFSDEFNLEIIALQGWQSIDLYLSLQPGKLEDHT